MPRLWFSWLVASPILMTAAAATAPLLRAHYSVVRVKPWVLAEAHFATGLGCPNMSNTGTGTWSGDGYPLRANESRPMGGSSGGPRNNFSAAGGGGRAGQKSGSFGKGKSSEQLTAEERKEALTKLWSGYRGSDFDVVPQKYLKCRDCNVRYRYQ